MASWPELDELKQRLDITSDVWDGDEYELVLGPTRLTRLLEAAIARTKEVVGAWDEYVDEPDEALAEYALRLAVDWARQPENTVPNDPVLGQLMAGHRRTFSFS